MLQPTRPEAFLSSILAVGLGAASCLGQSSQAVARNADGKQTAEKVVSLTGLPSWLVPVPAGHVWIGMTAEQLIQVCAESVPPHDPKRTDPKDPNFHTALKNTVSELGRGRVQVQAFLLAKWPITNREYRVFAERTGARIPYHWWRYGREDDYVARLEQINQAFPKDDKMAPLLYWERNWKDLPFELKDEKGKPIDDQPVRFVSWRDAVRCAGWLGMRLPTEVERTRAAIGDGENLYLWGTRPDAPMGDHFNEQVLDLLVLKNYRDQKLKNVGEVQFATGPYGHFDMVGQVWEWTATRELRPMVSESAFQNEWKRLQKEKLGQACATPPLWSDSKIVVKGGSYLYASSPVQLHVNARLGIPATETVEGVGFRLAKTPRPGFDMLFSLIRSGDYDQRAFGPDQAPNLDDQVGIESYDIGPTGFPEAYRAVSFAPVNFLTKDKSGELKKLMELSLTTPLVVGTLAATVKFHEPQLPEGIYTMLWRQKGQSRELHEALKAGCKQVQDEVKTLKRGGTVTPSEKPEEWRAVLAKFGIDPKDLELEDALQKIDFIRIGGAKVSTEETCLLISDSEGKVRGLVPLRADSLGVDSNPAAASIVLDAAKDAKEKDKVRQRLTIKFCVPVEQRNPKRATEIVLPMVLDQAPAAPDKPWRN